MNRRMFLRTIPAAPIAAKAAIGSAATALAAEQAAVQSVGLVGASVAGTANTGAFPSYGLHLLSTNATLRAAFHAGLLPEWARSDLEKEVGHDARLLSPDVAALRSVSLGAKFEMQRERTRRALWKNLEYELGLQMARQAFWRDHQ